MAEQMKAHVAVLLNGIDRYNPENLANLERYIGMQAEENTYDLEANLAVLKLYQFNPSFYQAAVTAQILLKALTNLPHTDFNLCKCLVDTADLEQSPVSDVVELADLLETCQFREFWQLVEEKPDLTMGVSGFQDSIRKFICHVVGSTYQRIPKELLAKLLGSVSVSDLEGWVRKYGWRDEGLEIFIVSQDDNVKTKNIKEKITLESVGRIMTTSSKPQVPHYD